MLVVAGLEEFGRLQVRDSGFHLAMSESAQHLVSFPTFALCLPPTFSISANARIQYVTGTKLSQKDDLLPA